MTTPTPRCLALLALMAGQSGSVLQHAPDVDPFFADDTVQEALHCRLIRHQGAALELTREGWQALGIQRPKSDWRLVALAWLIAIALLLLGLGETLGWWNWVRLDDASIRNPGPPASRLL